MTTQCPVCKGIGNIPCILCGGTGVINLLPRRILSPKWSSIVSTIVDDPKALAAFTELATTALKIFFGRK